MPRSKPTNPTPAIALEYNLAPGGDALNVATAVDHARFIVAPTCPDQCLFALFSVLVHGGGFPWFEDLYTFAGFMFTDPDVCRIYPQHLSRTDFRTPTAEDGDGFRAKVADLHHTAATTLRELYQKLDVAVLDVPLGYETDQRVEWIAGWVAVAGVVLPS